MNFEEKRKAEKLTQEYVRQSEAWISRAIKVIQSYVYGRVLEELTGFTLDKSGGMAFNVFNIRRAASVSLRVQAAVAPIRGNIIRRLFRRVLLLLMHNRRYHADITTQVADDVARRRVLLLYGYDVDKDEIIPGGYIDAVLSSAPVAQVLARQINAAILARTPINEFRKSFRQFFVNPGGTGYLDRHFTRFTHDIFMQVDRSIKVAYADELGLEHFVYAGTEIEDTRPFCIARLNRIYTRDKAEEWNTQQWAGKIPNIPALIQLGGYNCRHAPMFISAEMAKMIEKQSGQSVNGLNTVNRKRKAK